MRSHRPSRTMAVLPSLTACALIAWQAAPARATDNFITLNYNWNGIVHVGEGTNPDDPNGFRAIADRALYVDFSSANALGTNGILSSSGIHYLLVQNAGALDIVHLGNTGAGTTRTWDAAANGDLRGIQPSWLPSASAHTLPQLTIISPPLLIDANSSMGFLYHVSNLGGTFQVVLGFTDSSTVTLTLSANDWFGPTNPPAPQPGVASQSRLGNTTYTGTSNTDLPIVQTWPTQSLAVTEAVITPQSISGAGMGNIIGRSLSAITFQNPSQPTRGYAIFAATVINGLGPPINDTCATAQPIGPGTIQTDNLRATGSTTSPCGSGDTTDVWYSYTPASSGPVEVRTCGSALDTTIAIYTSCAGAPIACNDNGCGLASRVQWSGVGGRTDYIRVAGTVGATGTFSLTLDNNPAVHTDAPIPLACNWNGMVQPGEEGQPDAPAGFRSISDRAFYLNGAAGALNGGALLGTDFIPYSPVAQAGVLDIVHLGLTGVGSPRQWDPAANGDGRGIQPTWLPALDQRGPQLTALAGLHAAMGPNTRLGILYNVSNGGGSFDAVLTFADGSTATVTLAAPDWFQSQAVPAPGAGVFSQQQLGVFSATSGQDLATAGSPSLNAVEAIVSTSSLISGGQGDFTGRRLIGLTLTNPVSGTTSGFEIVAATLRDFTPDFSSIPPSGSGVAAPNPVEVGRTLTLTVAVSPGVDPPSTGLAVRANLAAFNGSATQQLFDDGTHGDATAGDNRFSYSFTVPAAQATGPYSISFSISDAQARSGSGSIALTVNPRSWSETIDGGGDAGELPASHQTVTGAGAVSAITGSMDASDTDMYEIDICDPANFTASTVNGATFDTQLFVFRTDGTGVVFDDDTPAGGVLQSALTGASIPGPGHYLLAISHYDRDPVDSSGQELWLDTPFNVERTPDGLGAANPVASWNAAPVAGGAYTIALTGVCFIAPANPCPADWDHNGQITPSDVAAFVNAWFTSLVNGTLVGDFDNNGQITPSDVAAFVNAWFLAVSTGC